MVHETVELGRIHERLRQLVKFLVELHWVSLELLPTVTMMVARRIAQNRRVTTFQSQPSGVTLRLMAEG